MEVLSWEASGNGENWGGPYRLRARPLVERPKVQPAPGKDQNTEPAEPINVTDMPAEYLLQFDPGLLVTSARRPASIPGSGPRTGFAKDGGAYRPGPTDLATDRFPAACSASPSRKTRPAHWLGPSPTACRS